MERRADRALVQLYDRYGRLVYALILRMVRNRAVAEDLTWETFLGVCRRARSFDGPKGALEPWLLAVGRNRALAYLRSQPEQDVRQTPFEECEDLRLYAALEAVRPFAEQARRAKAALARLPDGQRQAIELVCFAGLSSNGIGARLGQPPGTVKAWLDDALAALREPMETGAAE